MRPMTVPTYLGPLSLSILVLTSITSTQPLRAASRPAAASASGQMGSYRCVYRGQKATHDLTAPADNQIVYVTPIFHAAESTLGKVIQAFKTYMTTAYDLSKIQGPTAGCNSDVQASSVDSQEKQWAASKTEVIHVNWTDSPADSTAAAAAATPTAAATAQPLSAQSATFFISCSTSPDAGIDTYYTGVFDIGAKPGSGKVTPYAVGVYVGGTWMVPAVSSQSVLDHFQAYLTQKGYKFKPGSSSACDVKPTEAAAKAAQHKRAYEGGGCSTCGKVVETGWKNTP